jgi:hypothetical protein
MRKKEFKQPKYENAKLSDTRFGARRIYFNTNEKPSIKTWATPGKSMEGR